MVKLLIRRLLGRVALRGLLPFVAMPVSALWNGFVSWRVLREARIRAMGPSAIEELVKAAFDCAPQHSPESRLSAVRAVGSAIVRTQELHPNLVRLLKAVAQSAGELGSHELDDVGLFLSNLKTLSPSELKLSLQVLAVACVVDGRLSPRERKLWSDALETAGRPPGQRELSQLLRAFVSGDRNAEELLRAM